jgi:surfeit locus 1 family protein
MRRFLMHAVVLGLVVLMVNLGFWQLRRLDERRERNDLVAARSALPAAPVEALTGDPDELRFRPVTAAGVYGRTTAVRTTQDGATGAWVLSDLTLDGGRTVVVLRGFTALNDDASVPEPPPPGGEVAVEGLAIPEDRLPRIARTAADRLDADLPVVVQATEAEGELTPLPVPDVDDEGPHLGYAVQWFLFAAVLVVGYPILLKRRA